MIVRLLLVLFLGCAGSLFAQTRELKFDHLSKEDGLSSSDITSIVQDKQGFVWIGTIDGLNRYDGYNIKIYRNAPEDSTSLCDNRISVLYVDHLGELWIGTENNGLSRYNRNTDTFVNYSYKPYDSKSLSYYYVTSIVEDADQNLWVGTLSGLNLFNRKKDNFTHFLREIRVEITTETINNLKERGLPEKVLAALRKLQDKVFEGSESLLALLAKELPDQELDPYKAAIFASAKIVTTAENIRSLESGDKQQLWLGFERQGLGLFDVVKKRLLRTFRHSETKPNSLSSDEIITLQASGEQLWIGTRSGGLNRFDTKKETFYRYPHTIERSYIKCLFRDSKNIVWFGDGEGLVRYDSESDTFFRYDQSGQSIKGLSNLFVSAIAEDVQGNLWVGCDQGGVNMATTRQSFVNMTQHANNPAGLSKESVSSVLKDSKGNLWVGYFSMGIDFWDAETNTKTHYSYSAYKPGSVGEGTVFKIFEDSRGRIWVGTYRGGLQYFDSDRKSFLSYRHNPDDSATISSNDIRDIAEDKAGDLWIACHGGGISKFDPEAKTFQHYRADYTNWRNGLSNNWVHTVFCDSKGRIWAGSVSGVSVLKPGEKNFKSYNHNNSNLSHNSVRAIIEDKDHNIWLGTENGLNLFEEQKKQFKVFTDKEGLPNSFIMGGVADKAGKLWISTNNGLSRFDPTADTFRNYSQLDGLQSNEFFPGAYFKTKDDEFYFGGKSGLNIFRPDAIKDNPYKTPLLITDFKLFNQPVPVGAEGSPLKKQVSQTEEIVLSHNQNVISFGYVGLNYIRPEKNQYAYRLVGFEENWNYVGNKREATYTNLDPGTYELQVKAANNDGFWNEQPTSLRIVVRAPWWRTYYAFATYAVLLVLGLMLGRRIMLQRARERFILEQERREARQLHELDLMKLRFFTNISHEFRTPLSLILAPVEKLIKQVTDQQQQNQLVMMQRNGKRLLNLVNQLLDFRKLEMDGIGFYPSEGDLVKFTAETVHSFSQLSDKKHISLDFNSSLEALNTSFDVDKLEKILFNLLSNAFKFTPEGGHIAVELLLQQQEGESSRQEADEQLVKQVELRVRDSGIGIAPDKHEKIFERFYREELPNTIVNQGSGIGLSITKDFVKLHGGSIRVESQLGKGSCFVVTLPLKVLGNPAPAQQTESEQPAEQQQELVLEPAVLQAAAMKPPLKKGAEKLPQVLLVEDNEDFRQYLKESLGQYFTIIEARHGKEGWQKALAELPDLVVSDLMMPEMDGIEFCKKLKADGRTCHIPFVLLTAHTAEEQKLRGLDIGANDYITKPFSFELLLSRLRNLIWQRQLMQQVFEKKISVETSQAEIISLDDKLMQKAIQVVEANLSDADFSVELLSRELGMSRAHLYKKMVSITGKSPVEFIRLVRLERAAQYLEKSQLTVAEVAYQVGFNNTRYFSRYFKSHYNVLPSMYAATKQEEEGE